MRRKEGKGGLFSGVPLRRVRKKKGIRETLRIIQVYTIAGFWAGFSLTGFVGPTLATFDAIYQKLHSWGVGPIISHSQNRIETLAIESQ